MKMSTVVEVGTSNGLGWQWREETVEFEAKDHGKWSASYELGRECYRRFRTTRIHAEKAIKNEQGMVRYYAAPNVVREGAEDERLCHELLPEAYDGLS